MPATHRVAAGETLSAIARRYGLTVVQLMAANGIENADALIEGPAIDCFGCGRTDIDQRAHGCGNRIAFPGT